MSYMKSIDVHKNLRRGISPSPERASTARKKKLDKPWRVLFAPVNANGPLDGIYERRFPRMVEASDYARKMLGYGWVARVTDDPRIPRSREVFTEAV